MFKKKSEEIDFLVAGLGNPGEDYEHTLHNVGFDVIDVIAITYHINYWKDECGAKTARVKIGDKEVLLAKPQSFMNTSGGPISQLVKKYEIGSDSLIVIHDDLDLDPGVVRVKDKGSSGGHNGIKSIINKLGTQEFIRVKVGIGHPPFRKPVVDWVLSKGLRENQDLMQIGIERAALAVVKLCSFPVADVQNEFN